jgi:hypothetical protein
MQGNQIFAVDMNGDGNLDLVTKLQLVDAVSVVLGNGDGTFQAPKITPVRALGALTIADFNGDGKLDCALTTYGAVIVLLGDGTGFFQSTLTSPLIADPGPIVSADLNGDGKLDVVVGDVGKDAVLLGNGDGTFQPEVDYTSGADDDYPAIGDFNGDGKPDIATTGQEEALAVLLGNGDGTFQTAIQIPISFFPRTVLTADLNHDGKADLIAQSYFESPDPSPVAILLGNGDGTFQPEVDYSALGSNTGLATGDINGDGNLDLAVVSGMEGVAMILPGKGDGTFGIPSFAEGDGTPTGVAIGDFDGDGLGDIATLAPHQGRVSVFRHGQSVLSETSINFGHVPIGRQRTTPLTISNSGLTPFTITKTEIKGSYSENYTHTTVCDGITVSPGESCTLTIGYAPTTTFQLSGILVITSGGTPGTQSVTLYGTTGRRH